MDTSVQFTFGGGAFFGGHSPSHDTTLWLLGALKVYALPERTSLLPQTVIGLAKVSGSTYAVWCWILQAAVSAIFALSSITIAIRHLSLYADQRKSTTFKTGIVNTLLALSHGAIITLRIYDILGRTGSKSSLDRVRSTANILGVVASLGYVLLLHTGQSRWWRLSFSITIAGLSCFSSSFDGWSLSFLSLTTIYAGSFLIDSNFGAGESLFARLSFARAGRVITHCDEAVLDQAFVLPSSADPEMMYQKVLTSWLDSNKRLPGFWKILPRACLSQLALGTGCNLVALFCEVSKPWVLQMFLLTRTYTAVCVLTLVCLVSSIASTQAKYCAKLAGAKLKAGLVCLIYLRTLTGAEIDDGRLDAVTLIEVDVPNVTSFVGEMSMLLSIPMQIIAGLISLGILLGWEAAFAAAGGISLLLPSLIICNLSMKKWSIKLIGCTNKRMAITSEAIRNATLIKLWAQEPVIEKKLARLRSAELTGIEGIIWLSTALHMVGRSAPTLVSIAAFVAALASGRELTSERIFPALSMCLLSTSSLNHVPAIAAALAGCFASYGRVQDACGGDDTDSGATYTDIGELTAESALIVDHISFKWREKETSLLSEVSFSVNKGELVVLSGETCTGKSTLLKIILGVLESTAGRVESRGTLAYMSQDSWITGGTIQENILFGLPMEPEFYHRVVKACTLDVDFAMMESGDATVGSELSGGQQSRVALARAVYSRADVYILDAPLASLDSQVQVQIWEQVLGPRGILQGKTRLIVSDAVPGLESEYRQLMLIDGAVIGKENVATLVDVGVSAESNTKKSLFSKQAIQSSLEIFEEETPPDAPSQAHSHPESHFSPKRDASALDDGSEETLSLIPASLYLRWLCIAGFWRWFAVVLLTVLAFVSSVLASSMLKLVAQEMEKGLVANGLWLYAVGGAVQTLLAMTSLASAWYLGLRRTLQRVHALLVAGLFYSPLQFFDNTPPGTIINRFANDLAHNDMPVFGSMFGLLNQVLAILMSFSVLISALPETALAVIPSAALSWWLLSKCLPSLLKARTIENISRNPLLTNLQETRAGRDTIKVFAREEMFCNRHFAALRLNLQAYMTGVIVHLWLLIRLHSIAAILQGLAAAVLLYTKTGASISGFVLAYMLQISYSLATTISLRAQLDCDMTSVQRIFTIADLPPEVQETEDNIPQSWPEAGYIEFKDFTTGYADRPAVLKDINLKIRPGQLTAIVGRTGAGKSSLAASLMGVLRSQAGSIEIDGINIDRVYPRTLRSRIAMIPQTCRAFAGTVRQNLDPHAQYDEGSLQRALDNSLFTRSFASVQDALEFPITIGGANLGKAQLQLLALARCLLLDCKVIILDEATSAVDEATDMLVQEVIRQQVKDKTVISISHRLQSVMNADHVVVLRDGQVIEQGDPGELLARSKGEFKEMARAAGLASTLA